MKYYMGIGTTLSVKRIARLLCWIGIILILVGGIYGGLQSGVPGDIKVAIASEVFFVGFELVAIFIVLTIAHRFYVLHPSNYKSKNDSHPPSQIEFILKKICSILGWSGVSLIVGTVLLLKLFPQSFPVENIVVALNAGYFLIILWAIIALAIKLIVRIAKSRMRNNIAEPPNKAL